MSKPSLPVLLQQFFVHLRATQELSPHTIAAYRDAWRLLLRFMLSRTGKQPSQLDLAECA